MADLSIYNILASNTLTCVVFSVVGLISLFNLYYFVSNKLFKIKNLFGFNSFAIYFVLVLTIAYPIGVLSRFVYQGEFVLFDETIMNILFCGNTGFTKAVQFTYIMSSLSLFVLLKYHTYKPDSEK